MQLYMPIMQVILLSTKPCVVSKSEELLTGIVLASTINT